MKKFYALLRPVNVISLFFIAILPIKVFAQLPAITYGGPYTYDLGKAVSPLAPVNTGGAVPATVYGTTTVISSGFNNPLGIALDNHGFMYVADGSNDLVKKVEIATGTVQEISGFYNPQGITLDADGNIYVVAPNTGYVAKMSAADGTISYLMESSSIDIAIDAAGNLYTVGFYNGEVKKMDVNGNVSVIGSGFNYAAGIAVDAAGNVFIADSGNSMIKKIAAGTGEVTTVFETDNPQKIAVDAFGNIYVVSLGIPNITKWAPDGTITSIGIGYSMPYAVAIDAENNLYMADLLTATIKKIINTGYTITPELPEGLSFDITTGIISGTPTTLTEASDYTISAHNTSGTSTTLLNIDVLLPLPEITYSTPPVYGLGVAIAPLTPVSSGGAVSSYTIAPALPAGLSIDEATGIISGTPTVETSAQEYIVTASNSRGNDTFTLNIGVYIIAPSITYSSPKTYAQGVAINPLTPVNSGGLATGYTVEPPLPDGLTLDPETGVITGTPTAPSAAADYAITATNVTGNSIATLNITVQVAAPAISYGGPKRLIMDAAIVPLTPLNTGGTAVSYSVTPALPAGLTMDANTGIISGTPTALSLNTKYTITATNTKGNSVATVNMTVLRALPVISYGGEHAYAVGEPVSIAPVNTGGAVPATTLGTITTVISSGLSQPYGLTIDASGNYYVADYGNNRVRKITSAGSASTVGSGWNSPKNIVMDASGNFYVADYFSVKKITGGVVTTIASGIYPGGIAIDAEDNVYVNATADGVIKKISKSGTITNIGSGFVSADCIAVDPSGFIYITNRSTAQLLKLSPAGEVLATTEEIWDAYEIKSDACGNIYATYGGGGLVLKISGETGAVTRLTSATLNYPSGLTIDINGNVFVAENGGNKVKKVINTGYSISDALPSGLSFDKKTGIISGTVTDLSPMAEYIVTANNSSGSSTATVRLGVLPPPPVISYNSPQSYHKNMSISPLAPVSSGGEVTSYAIDPALPAGLTIDVISGIISGTPEEISPLTAYTVTATGNGTATAAITITVEDELPSVTYPITQSFAAGVMITPIVPVVSGPAITAFSISPALPNGLVFDTSTGIISGTPLAASANIYTINATGATGAINKELTIIIKSPPPVIAYTDNLIYEPGTTITPLAPVNTGGAVPASNYGQQTTVASGFSNPYGITVDAGGNVYVADYGAYTVNKIAANGVITAIGNGFLQPTGVVLDGKGNLYVADFGAGEIKKMGLETGQITTVASGFAPYGITLDNAGDIYANDYFNFVVKKIALADGTNTSIGSGFGYAGDLVVDNSGNVIVADSQNGLIKKVDLNGNITTLASELYGSYGVAIDPSGNIYAANGASGAIIKIAVEDNTITTIATNLNPPNDITLDPGGNIYISDYYGGITKIINTGYSISPALPDGLIFDATTGIISGTPTATTPNTAYTITAYNSAGSSRAVIHIDIRMTKPVISYGSHPPYYTGVTIPQLIPVNTGIAATSYSISPALPDGLSFDTLTGMISGTPAIESAATDYTVTAVNDHGFGTASINIAVLLPVPNITYTAPGKFRYNTAIVPLSPFNIGGAVTSGYTISPELPAGLGFNTETGVISGTPTVGMGSTAFTITALNAFGPAATTIFLAVSDPAPAISYNTPQYYFRNAAITPLTPANTGGTVPNLVLGQVSDHAPGLSSTNAVAVDNAGNIYATDGGSIVKISPEDGSFTTLADGFISTYDLAVDAEGYVYVADYASSDIVKIAPDGSTTVAASGLISPGAITLDPQGNMYISDLGNQNVIKVAKADGTVTELLTDITCYGLALDATGNLYASSYYETKIKKVTPAGVVSNFGSGLSNPSGIDFDDLGNLYVVNEFNGQIKKITPEGTTSTFITGINGAIALEVYGNELMYLANYSSGLKKVVLTGYAVSPSLPNGLSLNKATGVISGTPSSASASKVYTVTAYNSGGSATAAITIAVSTPSAATATVPADNTYITGQALTFTVTFNTVVNVTGSPYITLTLNSGGTTRAAYLSGSGTSTLTFKYTVTAGNLDNNGIVVATSISLNSGTIKDTGNNNATLTGISFAPTSGVLVNYSPQVIVFNTLENKTYGSGNFTLSATGGGSGKPVTYTSSDPAVATISGNTVTITGAGTTNITAAQAGNTNYSAANPVTQSLTIDKGTQAITFAALSNSQYGAAAFTLNATGGGSGNSVTYSSSNPSVATISGNTVNILGVGNTIINASQAGDNNYFAAEDAIQSLTVDKGIAALYLSDLLQNYDGTPKAAGAISNPEGLTGISITYNGSAALPTLPGSYAVIASLENDNYTAEPASGSLVIDKRTPIITFTSFDTKTYSDADFTPDASSTNSSSAISYSSNNPLVATIEDGKIHIVGAGTAIITAAQAGDDYNSATSTEQALTVNKLNIELAAIAKTKNYGEPDPELTFGVINDVFINSNLFTGTLSRAEGEMPGTYAITLSTLALNDNYVISYTGADLTILPSSNTNISLSLSPDAVLVNASETVFTTTVPSETTSITLTPAAEDPGVVVTIGGNEVASGAPSAPIGIDFGINTITVVVTAQDGTTVKTYSVKVTRALSDNTASKFKLNPNSVLVKTSPVSYTSTVGSGVTSVMLTPTTDDANASVTINGLPVVSGTASAPVTLNVGPTIINVLVTAQDGSTTKAYTVTVIRTWSSDATAKFKVDPSAILVLTTPFNYTTSVSPATTSITLTTVTGDAGATVAVNGLPVLSGEASAPVALNAGPTLISVLVTAQDGITTKAYTITVNRTGSSNVAVKFKLSPDALLVKNTLSSYTTSVSPVTSSVTLTPTTEDPDASVTINGLAVANGEASAPIALNEGPTDINVVVAAPDGITFKTYTITVNRTGSSNADASFKLSPIAVLVLTSPLNYTTSVAPATANVTLIPTAEDAGATVTVNGLTVVSGETSAPIALNVGPTTINVLVTAQDGITLKTYTITVNRTGSSNVAVKFKLDPDALFVKTSLTSYTTSVSPATTTVALTPVTEEAGALVTINSNNVASGDASAPIALNVGPTDITVVVTAPDGITTKIYTITVNRTGSSNADASFKLSPNAALVLASPLNYTTSVAPATASVTLTPTTEDAGATVTVNGFIVVSGQASDPITLNAGPTVINMVVTAQDGVTVKAYTVTVNRTGSNNTALKFKLNPNTLVVKTSPLSYITTVDAATERVTLTPTTEDPDAMVTVNSITVASRSASAPIDLSVGDNVVYLAVTAADGTTVRNCILAITRPPSEGGRSAKIMDDAIMVGGEESSSALLNASKKAKITAPELIIPNAISPNDDGANDYLVITNIESYPDNKIAIMTKTGNVVFRKTGYNNSEDTFTGKSPNGDRLPVGTYFYRLQYKAGKETKYKAGFVVVNY